MTVKIVYETHSWSEDNDRGAASGWRGSRLSARGRQAAEQLGARRHDDGLSAVFASDLTRAAETATVAFAGSDTPILLDWRLRECDFGDLNGMPAADLHHGMAEHLDLPYPGGESWRQAVERAGRFLQDLPLRWSGTRILIIGHVTTRWALDHFVDGKPLEELINADFAWREGWEYRLDL
ncbi:histidine phosphatase family protein [Microlunatus speluncae]|uniref:histidine phosphatase family protein n=1 Tax=Microlunatus speluncae TaxID=2594267 RepID=UPI0012665F7B|nr:histidine phosphatase family protein [Microlunatus speluncae]